MIDKTQRSQAAEIARSNTVDNLEDLHDKVVSYGLLAHLLKDVNLKAIQDSMADVRTRSVAHIMLILGDHLYKGCMEAAVAQTAQVSEIDTRLQERWHDPELTAAERLEQGITTAMDAEAVTLNTIRYRVMHRDSQITRRGLIESQRVPFRLALLHLSALDFRSKRIYDWDKDNRKIISDTAATMSPERGLHLTAEFPMMPGHGNYHEPSIGCPATLLDGFVRKLHTVAAEVTVQSDLIQLSDG